MPTAFSLRLFCYSTLTFLICFLIAQSCHAQSGNANSILSQLSASFSPNQVVQQIEIAGSATWGSGDSQDSGSVSLVASSNGAYQMQLSLASMGQRTESQINSGSSATCQWVGNDQVSHDIAQSVCWKPTLWFMPAITLQPTIISSSLGNLDLGSGIVGSDGNTYRHLQSQLFFTDFTNTLAIDAAQQSTTDIGLDPVTYLPTVLAYSVRPDSGAATQIAIEVHYSDYRDVNGVKIPFLIQRYVNGSLQLTIAVSSAQIS